MIALPSLHRSAVLAQAVGSSVAPSRLHLFPPMYQYVDEQGSGKLVLGIPSLDLLRSGSHRDLDLQTSIDYL